MTCFCLHIWCTSMARVWTIFGKHLASILSSSTKCVFKTKNECSFSVKDQIVIAKSDNYTMVFFVRGWLIASWIEEVRLHWSAVTGTYSRCFKRSFNYISSTKCKRQLTIQLAFFTVSAERGNTGCVASQRLVLNSAIFFFPVHKSLLFIELVYNLRDFKG